MAYVQGLGLEEGLFKFPWEGDRPAEGVSAFGCSVFETPALSLCSLGVGPEFRVESFNVAPKP